MSGTIRRLAIVAGLAISIAAPASAATLTTYKITASQPTGNFSGWSLLFEDTDGDMLMSDDEYIADSFTGTTFSRFNVTYDGFGSAASFNPIADGSGGTKWFFTINSGTSSGDFAYTQWSYTKEFVSSRDMGVVPVPASFPLLIAGIAGLGLAARRRKSAA